MLIIISFGSRRRGRLAGFLSVLSVLGFGLAGIAAIVCVRCATAGTRSHSRVSSSSLLLLTAIACFRRTTAGTRPSVGKHSVTAFHPVHTQDPSRYFLRWIGAWPSPAVTISSSFVGDPPRDGSRVLYSLRSSGSGESPLRYTSEFRFSWLRACKRTSSVLAICLESAV